MKPNHKNWDQGRKRQGDRSGDLWGGEDIILRSLPQVEGSRGQEELKSEASSGKRALGLCSLGHPFCHLMITHLSCTNDPQVLLRLGVFLLLLLLNSPVVHWTLDPRLQCLFREAITGPPAVRKGGQPAGGPGSML